MKVRLYDGWNAIRIATEKDQSSLSPRRLYHEMIGAPDVLQVWVWDGAGSRKTRQAIFPGYKAKRLPAQSDVYATMLLWRDILKHSIAYSVEVAGAEADDVIAALVKHYAPTATSVEIISNDYDLMALTAGRPNVFSGANKKDHVKPEDIQIYKSFAGDSSDEVPGVKGFGEKSWLAADKRVLHNIAHAAVTGDPHTVTGLTPFMFSGESRGQTGIKAWINENWATLAAMYRCVGFLPIPVATITDAIHRPIHNDAAVQALFKEYFL